MIHAVALVLLPLAVLHMEAKSGPLKVFYCMRQIRTLKGWKGCDIKRFCACTLFSLV